MFIDRNDAATRLADRLEAYRGRHPLVLAIPRGAVPMARAIAERLGGDFDVVLVRKLRAPYQPELAVGSVGESGWTYVSPFAGLYGADAAYLESEKNTQMETIRKRRAQYTPIRPPIDRAGRGPAMDTRERAGRVAAMRTIARFGRGALTFDAHLTFCFSPKKQKRDGWVFFDFFTYSHHLSFQAIFVLSIKLLKPLAGR